MRQRPTLAVKLVKTGIAFLAVALASIALTLWVSWQLEGGGAAVNEAGRMRMLTYRIAATVASDHPEALRSQVASMDATLLLLRTGDPSRPLFVPDDAASRRELERLQTRWSAWRAGFQAGTAGLSLAEADTWVRDIERFVSSIERRLSYWTALLRAVQLTLVAVAIASALLLLYASHLMILEPLRRLGEGLAQIRLGDFGARVPVGIPDEFGEIAEGFNAMAARLQALYGNLEAKVREKTARLEVRGERLAALYEMSAFVARAENLESLAQGFVARVRRIARADAVAVRWSDERGERHVLLAHEGLPDAFVQREQCIGRGDCECGQPQTDSRAKVVPIRAPAVSLGHCHEAGFRTLVTVPITLHQRALGEIALFYRGDDPLDEEGHSLLETLAGHLAGGMEGLRTAAAEKEAAIAGERSLLAQELHDSIAQSLAFLKIQVGLLDGAFRREDRTAARRTIDEIDSGVRECYGDVRELLLHFRTRAASEDIGVALQATLQKFEHQSGVHAALEVHGDGVPLPADTRVQVLHMVQEALSNVRKHAGATCVQVRVTQAPEWRFEIVDDGCGFDAADGADDSHVGLRIMRERADRIGAEVRVESAPGRGTRVVIGVPLHPAQDRRTSDELADATAGR